MVANVDTLYVEDEVNIEKPNWEYESNALMVANVDKLYVVDEANIEKPNQEIEVKQCEMQHISKIKMEARSSEKSTWYEQICKHKIMDT